MALKFANNAVSTLAAPATSGATTITIDSADQSRFPALSAGDWYPLTLLDADGNMEIVRATARAGALITITRAQEATSARAFDTGTRIGLRLTAAALAEFAFASAVAAVSSALAALDAGLGDLAALDTVDTGQLVDLSVSNGKISNRAALSIMGRSANSSGVVADIVASTDGQVLTRDGTSVVFGGAGTAGIKDLAVTFAKMATAAVASQTEAEAGAVTDKLMTAERTAQAIAKLGLSQAAKISVFSASGTWTKDPKTRYVRLWMAGSTGGGGGYFNGVSGGQGGSSPAVTGWYAASAFGTSEAITIGSAGSGGTANNDGTAAGASSIGRKVSISGSGGGKKPASGAVGAVGSIGVVSGALPASQIVDDYGVGNSGGNAGRGTGSIPAADGNTGWVFIWEFS